VEVEERQVSTMQRTARNHARIRPAIALDAASPAPGGRAMSDEPDWKLELIDGLMAGSRDEKADDLMERAAHELTAAWVDIDSLRAAGEGVIDRQFAEMRFNKARDEAADEIARLRAALADERAHADALAEALEEIANLPAGKTEAVATAKRARHIAICARRQG